MFVLGGAVGHGSTALDDWMLAIDGPEWLLRVVDVRLLAAVLVASCATALWQRRFRLAAVVAVFPLAGVWTAQALKRVFARELDGELAYPSGHTTALVITAGMVILVAGARRWAVGVVAALVVAAGMYAVGTTFHYFTDTVGALLLGSSVVALGAQFAEPAPGRS